MYYKIINLTFGTFIETKYLQDLLYELQQHFSHFPFKQKREFLESLSPELVTLQVSYHLLTTKYIHINVSAYQPKMETRARKKKREAELKKEMNALPQFVAPEKIETFTNDPIVNFLLQALQMNLKTGTQAHKEHQEDVSGCLTFLDLNYHLIRACVSQIRPDDIKEMDQDSDPENRPSKKKRITHEMLTPYVDLIFQHWEHFNERMNKKVSKLNDEDREQAELMLKLINYQIHLLHKS